MGTWAVFCVSIIRHFPGYNPPILTRPQRQRNGLDLLVGDPLAPQIPGTKNADASANNPTSSAFNTGSLKKRLRVFDLSSAIFSTTSAPLVTPYPLPGYPTGPGDSGPMSLTPLSSYFYVPVATPRARRPTAGLAHTDEFGSLPAGRERQIDPTGLNYYVDHSARKATLHQPIFDPGANNIEQQAASLNPLGSLPAGWEERRTPEGKVYFVDRKSNSDSCLGAKAK